MSASSAEGTEPNLTPVLDMVFQLITFFMLVINFKGAASDMTLKLPVLGSARPLDWKGEFEPLVLNLDPEGKVHVYGRPVAVDEYVTREAAYVAELMRTKGEAADPKAGLPVPVVVRADRSVPFRDLNRVIKVCQQHGYRQFSLSAMTREEGR